MGASEACCERVGSLMRRAWTPFQRQAAAELMEQVLLDDAGVQCVGSERDEFLAQEVADLLLEADRRPLNTSRAAKKRRREASVNTSVAVRRLKEGSQVAAEQSGRRARSSGVRLSTRLHFTSAELAERSRRAPPPALSFDPAGPLGTAMAQALRAPAGAPGPADSAPPRPSIQAPPLYLVDPRAASRSRAGSTIREEVRAWLGGVDGRA